MKSSFDFEFWPDDDDQRWFNPPQVTEPEHSVHKPTKVLRRFASGTRDYLTPFAIFQPAEHEASWKKSMCDAGDEWPALYKVAKRDAVACYMREVVDKLEDCASSEELPGVFRTVDGALEHAELVLDHAEQLQVEVSHHRDTVHEARRRLAG